MSEPCFDPCGSPSSVVQACYGHEDDEVVDVAELPACVAWPTVVVCCSCCCSC